MPENQKPGPRRAGRPRTKPDGPGEIVTFRVPSALKARLWAAAAAHGQSLSAEMQSRIERSLTEDIFAEREDRILDAIAALREEMREPQIARLS